MLAGCSRCKIFALPSRTPHSFFFALAVTGFETNGTKRHGNSHFFPPAVFPPENLRVARRFLNRGLRRGGKLCCTRLAEMMKDDAPSPSLKIPPTGGFHRPCQFEHEITGANGTTMSTVARAWRATEKTEEERQRWWEDGGCE